MTKYHASFCIIGEVVDMLCLQEPTHRLLIDITARPESDQESTDFMHRTAFTVTDPELIKELMTQISAGDVVEATGSFWQTGYVPGNSGVVDTIFRLTCFRLIGKSSAARYNPYRALLRDSNAL